MLYMVDYFTEDEWMKIDVCIHKGQYVFTKGPPKHILDLDMSDEGQSSEAATSLLLDHVDRPQSAERQEKEEESAPVESAEETNDAVDSGTGSILDLSSPPSSAEEPTEAPTSDGIVSWVVKAEKEEESPFDLAPEMSQPPKPVEAPPAARGPVYTQEQLEAAKAMNRSFTKAPEPGSGRAKKVVSNHKDNYRDNESLPQDAVPETEEYLSSNTPEDNRRINQWATEAESASQQWSQPTDPQERLVAEFILRTGKVPKTVNDIYQPNNHKFIPLTARPASRTTSTKSIESMKFAKSLASVVGRMQPKRGNSMTNFKPGVVLIAQVDVTNPPGKVSMVVKAGDSIKLVKHVSGIHHLGKNLTSGACGQVSEDIFSRPTALLQRVDKSSSEPETASVVNLDHFERENAAQWDEVPVPKRARAQPAPALKSNFGGLAKSRYAVLEDELPASSSCSEQDPEYGRSGKVAGKEDTNVSHPPFSPTLNSLPPPLTSSLKQFDSQQQHLDAQMPYPNDSRRSRQPKTSWKEPLKPVEPRRETCTYVHSFCPPPLILSIYPFCVTAVH